MYDGRNIFKFKNMIEQLLRKHIQTAIEEKYHQNDIEIQFQKTRKEFDGDVTLVVFPISKFSKKSPELTAEEIGCYLKDNTSEVISFNVVLQVTFQNAGKLHVEQRRVAVAGTRTSVKRNGGMSGYQCQQG